MGKKSSMLLPTLAIAVVLAAVSVGVVTKSGKSIAKSTGSIAARVSESELSFSTKGLGFQVQYIDYDSNGMPLQLLAVRDGGGRVHVTLNTCQNCYGSPLAFFEQDGGSVTCQNCGISHPISQLGTAKLGCNPIPVRYDEKKGSVSILRSELDKYAPLFANWKKDL